MPPIPFSSPPNQCSTSPTSTKQSNRSDTDTRRRGDRAKPKEEERSFSVANSRPSWTCSSRSRSGRVSCRARARAQWAGRPLGGSLRSPRPYDVLNGRRKEARAWPIPKGTKAPKAAGTIHSDLERGFIRAEVIPYDDYVGVRKPGGSASGRPSAKRGPRVRDARGRRCELSIQRVTRELAGPSPTSS